MNITSPGFVQHWQNKLFTNAISEKNRDYLEVSQRSRYLVIAFLSLAVLGTSFFFSSISEIFDGLMMLLVAPSILVTDYMAVADIGTAFFNSGLLMLISMVIIKLSKVKMEGPVIAAIFTIGGFALFGKNLFNIWPIMLGVWLYSRFRREKFRRFILIALFGTALGPMVSQISFGFDLSPRFSIILGVLIGTGVGFCLPPMANHFVVFHQGFNLYNIGFTSGIIGMGVMALFRGFNYDMQSSTLIVSHGQNFYLSIFLFVYFLIMLLVGLALTRSWLGSLRKIMQQPGRLVSDFVSSHGFGPSIINMALLGMLSTIYILLVKGELNGPTIGGIFTVVGFGAFGKHLKNVIPIFGGVYLASMFKLFEVNSTGALLAALFGTTLAPIAGVYGWSFGIIAGFIHMSVVMNVGYLHGGMNLYNNGFAGGFVAAILVPIFDAIRNNGSDDKIKGVSGRMKGESK